MDPRRIPRFLSVWKSRSESGDLDGSRSPRALTKATWSWWLDTSGFRKTVPLCGCSISAGRWGAPPLALAPREIPEIPEIPWQRQARPGARWALHRRPGRCPPAHRGAKLHPHDLSRVPTPVLQMRRPMRQVKGAARELLVLPVPVRQHDPAPVQPSPDRRQPACPQV